MDKMQSLELFGEAFLCILYNEINHDDCNYIKYIIDFASALKEENVSKDMAVFLMMQYGKDKDRKTTE